MASLSRNMLPRTERSASRFCGGRRSGPMLSGDIDSTSLWSALSGILAESIRAATVRERLERPLPYGRGSDGRLLLHFDDRDLHFGFDLVAQVQFDGVQAGFL